MKTLISFTLTIILIVCHFTSQAQSFRKYDYDIDFKKHEFYIQYGTPTFQEYSTQLRDQDIADVVGYNLDQNNWGYTGVGAIGYNYYINPDLSVGGYFGISGSSMKFFDIDANNELVAKKSISSYTGMIGANYTYFRRGIIDLSGSALLGALYKDESLSEETTDPQYSSALKSLMDNPKWGFAYHLTFCRVRVGNNIAGFAEVGLGCKGIVNVGLSVKL